MKGVEDGTDREKRRYHISMVQELKATPPPPPTQMNKSGLKLVCNVNIVHKNACTQDTIVLKEESFPTPQIVNKIVNL